MTLAYRTMRAVTPISRLLEVDGTNARYVTAPVVGGPLLLTGSHTWYTIQDVGSGDPPTAFGFDTWLSTVVANGHNFTRLFVWEQGSRTESDSRSPWWVSPTIYSRTGPGNALDGKAKFDLTSFNQTFFDRLRTRCETLAANGLYVSVPLFQGFSVKNKGYPTGFNVWVGHPFNASNNIQAFEGGDGEGDGARFQTLYDADVTAYQEAYVRKLVDTVNHLDTIVYEICNESDGADSFDGHDTNEWQDHFIAYLQTYEATKAKQHLIFRTICWPSGSWADCLASDAELVSPNSVTDSDGTKVVVIDTDHIGVGLGDADFVWSSFCAGAGGILFMDRYNTYTDEWGTWDPTLTQYENCRDNLGWCRALSQQLPLASMSPQGSLASTGVCLAYNAATHGHWVVWMPTASSCTLNVSATSRTLTLRWMNADTGAWSFGDAVTGGATRTLTAPASGNWVAHVYDESV